MEWWKVFIFKFSTALCFHPHGDFYGSLIQPSGCQNDWWGWCLEIFKSLGPLVFGQKSKEKFCESYWSISCWVKKHILEEKSFLAENMHFWTGDILTVSRWALVEALHTLGPKSKNGAVKVPAQDHVTSPSVCSECTGGLNTWHLCYS